LVAPGLSRFSSWRDLFSDVTPARPHASIPARATFQHDRSGGGPQEAENFNYKYWVEDNSSSAWHPDAVKYFKEKGLAF
jgi:hypothetical protein